MKKSLYALFFCWFVGALFFFQQSYAKDLELSEDTPEEIQNFINTARAELGIIEERDGTTKYGIWAGEPKAEWCAEFLCWAVHETDRIYNSQLLNIVYPKYSGQNVGRDWFIRQGRYVNRVGAIPGWGYQWDWETGTLLTKNAYTPKSGDFMFLGYEGNFNTSHVALVEFVEEKQDEIYIHVIEGNNPDRVQRNIYPLSKHQILGYGLYENTQIGTTMRVGNKGYVVETLQKELCGIGLLSEYDITGIYDSKTASAVTEIQRKIKHAPNGIADYETQKAIREAYTKSLKYIDKLWTVEEEDE